jgi:hypothetical protein
MTVVPGDGRADPGPGPSGPSTGRRPRRAGKDRDAAPKPPNPELGQPYRGRSSRLLPSSTLCVAGSARRTPVDAERPGRHSHAERGNEGKRSRPESCGENAVEIGEESREFLSKPDRRRASVCVRLRSQGRSERRGRAESALLTRSVRALGVAEGRTREKGGAERGSDCAVRRVSITATRMAPRGRHPLLHDPFPGS